MNMIATKIYHYKQKMYNIDCQAINEYIQALSNKGINIIDLYHSEYLYNIYIDDNDYEKYNNIVNDISSDIHRKYKDITKNIACLPIKWKMSWDMKIKLRRGNGI